MSVRCVNISRCQVEQNSFKFPLLVFLFFEKKNVKLVGTEPKDSRKKVIGVLLFPLALNGYCNLL